MTFDGGVADQLAIIHVYGHHNRGVLRVRAGHIGIGDQENVAGIEGLLATRGLDRRAHAEVHRSHEQRQAGRLGQQPELAVVDGDREVENIIDDG